MASQASMVDHLLGQMSGAGEVTAKKMFGEYGLFCAGKMVALVCDDQLFVKITPAGRTFAGKIEEAPPYPGAKNCLLVPETKWDEREWLGELIRLTARDLPVPPPKRAQSTKR